MNKRKPTFISVLLSEGVSLLLSLLLLLLLLVWSLEPAKRIVDGRDACFFAAETKYSGGNNGKNILLLLILLFLVYITFCGSSKDANNYL